MTINIMNIITYNTVNIIIIEYNYNGRCNGRHNSRYNDYHNDRYNDYYEDRYRDDYNDCK